jgi:hypothetical protein
MATPAAASPKNLLDTVARGHAASVKACETFVNQALGKALRQNNLGLVRLETAIFTRVGPGLVVNAAIPLKGAVTKGHLLKRAHAVGVLANTLLLRDPITNIALAPGAALVELRPVPTGEFAFDFVGGDGRTRFSTRAVPKDPDGFESLAPDRPIAAAGFCSIDIDVYGGGPGPNDPLPPGNWIICVSYLAWRYCGAIDITPTVPSPGPIIV